MRSRSITIDTLKVVASQAIVWHHLAFYGPMSDIAMPLAHDLVAWLARDARIAVQVFLVIGGFLAAGSLLPWMQSQPTQSRLGVGPWVNRVIDRYLRLVGPLVIVIVAAIAATALAQRGMPGHPSLPEPATTRGVLAHALLMQDVLGLPALSAGIWYVAIDFQLYVVLVLLIAIGERMRASPTALLVVIAVTGAASLLAFNRWSTWDVSAAYFWGAYGLGVLAAGTVMLRRPFVGVAWVALLTAAALVAEWRARVALAGVVAVVLIVTHSRRSEPHDALELTSASAGTTRRVARAVRSLAARMMATLSARSYALFLAHFPVCLLVNAAFMQWAPVQATLHAVGLVIAWMASMLAAEALHRGVERPWLAWVAKRRRHDSPRARRSGV